MNYIAFQTCFILIHWQYYDIIFFIILALQFPTLASFNEQFCFKNKLIPYMTLCLLLAVLVASIAWITIIPRQTCLCNQYGSIDSQCNFTSKDTCKCRSGFNGTYCETCSDGYFNFPNCTRKFMMKHFSWLSDINFQI